MGKESLKTTNSGEITGLKALNLDTDLGEPGSPRAAIVAGDDFMPLAEVMRGHIYEVLRVDLPLLSDSDAIMDLKAHGNLITLGQFGNNKVLEYLYYRWYVVVDGAQPGRGGYILQTIHNPDALGINIIVLGGSDGAGVEKAASRLVENIREHGFILPRLFEVELGAGRDIVLARGEEVLDPEREWPALHPMEVQQALAEAGVLYLYTGREDYALAYRERLLGWLQGGDFRGASDDFYGIMITWDLLEESSVFSDEERLWITNKLWGALKFLHSPQEVNYKFFMEDKDKWASRENHRTRYANSIYFGSRYYSRYYGMDEASLWLDEVGVYWKPQMASFAPLEGHNRMAHITLTEAVTYALADNQKGFLSQDILGMIAERGLMETMGRPEPLGLGSRLATPMLFLCLAAHRFDEAKHLRPIFQSEGSMDAIRLPWMVSWELGRSFWDGLIPSEVPNADVPIGDFGMRISDFTSSSNPKSPTWFEALRKFYQCRGLLGRMSKVVFPSRHIINPQYDDPQWVVSMPLDRLFFETAPTYGPVNVPFEESFDFLSFKDPSGRGMGDLSINGHNAGKNLSRNEPNSITSFRSHGLPWLEGGGEVATIAKHTALSVVQDGEGHVLPAYARLLRAQSTANWGISRTALMDYNGTDWYRNIVSALGKWFLVVDEIIAREQGDYVLENRWNSHAHGGYDGDDFIFIQRGRKGEELELRFVGDGWDNQYVIPRPYSDYLASGVRPFPVVVSEIPLEGKVKYTTTLARRWGGSLEKGGSHVFANLFYVHPRGERPAYRLRKLDQRRYLVEGDGANWLVAADAKGKWFFEELETARALAEDKGAKPASISTSGANGLKTRLKSIRNRLMPIWHKSENARILSSTSMSVSGRNHWALGLGDGRIQILGAEGQTVSTMKMAGMVFGLSAMDLNGDGCDELIAGVDSGAIGAFTVDGGKLWSWTPPPWQPPSPSWRQSMGKWRTVISDIVPISIEADGTYGVLASGVYFYLLDRDGGMISMYDVRGESSLSKHAGQGYKTGLWRTPESTFILALGDINGDDLPEIVGGTPLDLSVRVWDAKSGKRIAAYRRPGGRYRGSIIKAVAAADFNGDGKDEFVVGSDAFRDQLAIYAYPEGLLWSRNPGSSVEVVGAGDLNEDGKAEIIVGTELGQLQAFDGEGRRLFVADLGGPAASLAVVEGRDRVQIWAGTLNGRLCVLDGQGRLIGQADLPTCIDHLSADARGERILATSAEGHMAVFEMC